jgi:catechol 2,3-dioxygenase-like lactoylglutathione lyase family enzyme
MFTPTLNPTTSDVKVGVEVQLAIFTHIVLGTNNLEKAQSFYDGALNALGYKRLGSIATAAFYGATAPELMITRPLDGNPATPSNGATVSFIAPTRAAVTEFHKRALALGGICEGLPGPRSAAPNAYAAYVRDPDGNKLAAYCFAAE